MGHMANLLIKLSIYTSYTLLHQILAAAIFSSLTFLGLGLSGGL